MSLRPVANEVDMDTISGVRSGTPVRRSAAQSSVIMVSLSDDGNRENGWDRQHSKFLDNVSHATNKVDTHVVVLCRLVVITMVAQTAPLKAQRTTISTCMHAKLGHLDLKRCHSSVESLRMRAVAIIDPRKPIWIMRLFIRRPAISSLRLLQCRISIASVIIRGLGGDAGHERVPSRDVTQKN
ncbi:hypothetical protein BDR07DRAFT_1381405 [Suillus spraguei]|nr:hypothetical protein BDR07DRAFT_1381405 [Suillus spraguei]